jgi:hypothetical protein
MKKILLVNLMALLLFTPYLRADEVELIVKMFKTPLSEQIDFNKKIEKQYEKCNIENGTNSKLSSACKRETTPQLRNLFKTFYVNQPKKNKTSALRTKLSKLMGMIMKESSGNPSAVADMNGKGSRKSYMSFFKINKSKGITSRVHYSNTQLLEDLLKQSDVTFNKQTNFGLAQLSADRLTIKKWGGDYLKAKQVLIKSLPEKELLNWCMTRSVYNDNEATLKKYATKIKSCQMGYKDKAGVKCFARIVNFCPRLAIDLALEQPLRYFETKKASPLCVKLFE